MLTFLIAPLHEWLQGEDSPEMIRAQNDRAMRYLATGRAARAVPLYRRTLSACERIHGPSHPNTLRSRYNLAMSYRAAGRPDKAIPLFEQTLAACERVLGADHPDTKAARANLAALTGRPAAGRRTAA